MFFHIQREDAGMSSGRARIRWFQFRLKTLLLILTAVALWLGWRSNCSRQQREVVAAVEAAGGRVVYAHQEHTFGCGPPPAPAWLRRLVGDEYFQEVALVDLSHATISDELFEQLSRLSTIRALDLGNSQIKDSHMRYVARLPRIKRLNFRVNPVEVEPRITIAGIRQLASCQSIETLYFNDNCQLADDGLACIGQLPNLRELWFRDVSVTDAGIKHLRGHSRLETLLVEESSITGQGLAHLETLPNLKTLELSVSPTGDDGMIQIGRCKSLVRLTVWLPRKRITDGGLRQLKGLKNLRQAQIVSGPITAADIAELQQALPDCHIP